MTIIRQFLFAINDPFVVTIHVETIVGLFLKNKEM